MSKDLIDSLKESPRSKEELIKILGKKLPNRSHDALRKRVERFMSNQISLGLVEKRGDKYCWYIYVNDFKKREYYYGKLQHSCQLIPALRWIAGMTWPRYIVVPQKEVVSADDLDILVKGAEDHLVTYPIVWRLLEDSKKISETVNETKKAFCDKLMEKLRNKFKKEHIVETNKTSTHPTFVKNNIPLLICNWLVYDSPKTLRTDGDEIWFGDTIVAKGKELLNHLEVFIENETEDEECIKNAKRIAKLERDAIKIRGEIEQEIRKLILKIESGEPLLGGCELCPKIYL